MKTDLTNRADIMLLIVNVQKPGQLLNILLCNFIKVLVVFVIKIT